MHVIFTPQKTSFHQSEKSAHMPRPDDVEIVHRFAYYNRNLAPSFRRSVITPFYSWLVFNDLFPSRQLADSFSTYSDKLSKCLTGC